MVCVKSGGDNSGSSLASRRPSIPQYKHMSEDWIEERGGRGEGETPKPSGALLRQSNEDIGRVRLCLFPTSLYPFLCLTGWLSRCWIAFCPCALTFCDQFVSIPSCPRMLRTCRMHKLLRLLIVAWSCSRGLSKNWQTPAGLPKLHFLLFTSRSIVSLAPPCVSLDLFTFASSRLARVYCFLPPTVSLNHLTFSLSSLAQSFHFLLLASRSILLLSPPFVLPIRVNFSFSRLAQCFPFPCPHESLNLFIFSSSRLA